MVSVLQFQLVSGGQGSSPQVVQISQGQGGQRLAVPLKLLLQPQVYIHTYIHTYIPVKSLDTPAHSKVFLYFFTIVYYFHCRIILKTSKLWNNTWNHVVTKKVLNKSKYILYLRIFKVATLCLDSFIHSRHSLNQLHLECFFYHFEGVPKYAEHLLAAIPSLCGPTHPKPSQLGWVRVMVEARSSDAVLHHSPSWSNSPYTTWRCVGSLSCWKINDIGTMR